MFSAINFEHTPTWAQHVYGQPGGWRIMKMFSISMANFRNF